MECRKKNSADNRKRLGSATMELLSRIDVDPTKEVGRPESFMCDNFPVGLLLFFFKLFMLFSCCSYFFPFIGQLKPLSAKYIFFSA